jgi:hypothetical protein
MNIDDQINREIGVHGQSWNALHEGYFSDDAVARPFISVIKQYLSASETDVLADLGGGTGFILHRLAAQCKAASITPVNMDCSAIQLDTAKTGSLSCINRLISDFSRNDLAPVDKRILFIMRSVLHYLGKDGLNPVLFHIRKQALAGEMFVHQSACFANILEAQRINALYREMGTPKWYPTISELRESMSHTKWQVMDIIPAPSLKLSSTDLGNRYGLDTQALAKICDSVTRDFGEADNIFQRTEKGFVAYLHYRIFVARAA